MKEVAPYVLTGLWPCRTIWKTSNSIEYPAI